MAASEQYNLARLADRMQIQDTIFKWCRAIDRLDYEAVREAFHEDATDDHGPFKGNVDGLIDWIRERHQGIVSSMHLVGNILIEFAGDHQALAESYVMCVQRYSAEGSAGLAQISGGVAAASDRATDLLIVVRYVDRFQRRNGQWRIAARTVVFDNIVQFTAGSDAPSIGDSWAKGARRDQKDFLYAEQAALGL